jgi:hypothetical protein
MIIINKKEFKFKFGFKAALLFEKETGKGFAEIGSSMTFEQLAAMVSCGLRAAGEKVTTEQVIDWIDEDPSIIAQATQLIGEGMAAFNQLEKVAKKSKPKQ